MLLEYLLEAKISLKSTRNVARSQKMKINICKKTVLGLVCASYEVFAIGCVTATDSFK